MTQKQLIEQIAGHYPETAEGQIREMLNQVADDFAEETAILEANLTLTTAEALSYSLNDRVARVKSVTIDGKKVPHFSPHLEGKAVWQVVGGDTLEIGKYYSDGLKEADGTTVKVSYIALPTKFAADNLDTESDIPARFQLALALRVQERLELFRVDPNTGKTRALYAQYSDLKRKAVRAANSGGEGGGIKPRLYDL